MKFVNFIKKTAGGAHAWWEAEHHGFKFLVRKPIGAEAEQPVVRDVVPPPGERKIGYKPAPARRTWWQKLIDKIFKWSSKK
jgi:hypothetical protein